eukprot:11219200-Lingulodinium_polyedra.AAC.1
MTRARLANNSRAANAPRMTRKRKTNISQLTREDSRTTRARLADNLQTTCEQSRAARSRLACGSRATRE